MTSDHAPPPLEVLLAHRGWVRTLARRLTDNAVDADDLEQDAWLAAARARPREGAGLLAWFAKVMRNRAAERRRLDGHRAAREELAARPVEVRSGAALVDAEAHARVVQAVLDLREPYRETVLLRFYEGRAVREIAVHMGVPADTVKTRLRRANEMLRAVLGGRREDWLGALAPLLDPRAGSGTAVATTGGIAMKASAKFAIAAVALLSAAAILGSRFADRAPAPAAAPGLRAAAAIAPLGAERVAASRRRTSGNDIATARAATSDESVEASAVRVVGRILLPDGAAAAGAAVGGPDNRWTNTDADGRYSATFTPFEGGEARPLWVLLPGFRAAGVGLFPAVAGATHTAPDVRLAADTTVVVRGRVVSRGGREITSGEVVVTTVTESRIYEAARRALDPGPMLILMIAGPGSDAPAALRAFEASNHAAVGAGGAFQMRLSESLGSVTLMPKVPGHATISPQPRPVREWAEHEVELQVEPIRSIRGKVLDDVSGAPIEGARVGPDSLRTDATGAFEWTPPDGGWSSVRVTAPSYFEENVSPMKDGSPVTVRLSRQQRLEGVVRLWDGTPVTHASVAYRGTEWWEGSRGTAETDSDGRFQFSRVRDGTFTVTAQATQTSSASFLAKSFPGVAAGRTDLELVVEPALTIAGRVVDGDGRPVPRISIAPTAAFLDTTASGVVVTATSGDDGSFVVQGLPPGRCKLQVVDAAGAAGGYLPHEISDVAVGTRDLAIVVRMGLTITGRVVDSHGRAVFGKRVLADDVASNPLRGGFGNGPALGTDGSFVVRGLRPGRYRLELGDVTNDPSRGLLAGGESVEAGATDLTLTLVDGGTIAGVLVDDVGAPIVREWVTALWTPADDKGRSVQSDEKGRFEFRGLPPDHVYAVKAGDALLRDVSLGTRDLRIEVRSRGR